ncbi:MAG: AzlD domain-containing protein [Roseiflexaceae bacterium]|nr:AzlD domain-containing protein [Chloroflexaceae bacterium]
MSIWLTFVGMMAVTYAARAIPLIVMRNDPPPWLALWLKYVPPAVFTALIVPAVVTQTVAQERVLVAGPAIGAALIGALVAWRTSNAIVTVVVGMLAFWGIRAVLGGM